MFTVGINRAVDLLAEKKAKRRPAPRPARRSRNWARIPDGGGNVQVMSGRYGPYVKHGKINATLPRDKTPEDDDAG